jgi:hypothetical protein
MTLLEKLKAEDDDEEVDQLKEEESDSDGEERLSSSPPEAVAAKKRWGKLKRHVKQTGVRAVVGKFEREGSYHKAMNIQHKRLWILKLLCAIVSLAFFGLQVFYLVDGSEGARG